jgi:GT2 family glycosyltransferase
MNGENMNEENKKETVCAVVVTYNRKNLLLECLEAIRRQTRPVDGIYIIDNASDDGTPELLKEKGYIPELPPFNLPEPYEIEHKISNLVDGNHINVFYVRMHENTGGAGGFYEGVKRGYEKGYDWLWLMDDDTKPEDDGLKNLLGATKQFKSMVYQMARINVDGRRIPWEVNLSSILLRRRRGVFNLNVVNFEGLFIKRDLVNKVGFPDARFFIAGDDTEYGLRISKISTIYVVENSKIYRLLPDNLLSKKPKVSLTSYYTLRNSFLLARILWGDIFGFLLGNLYFFKNLVGLFKYGKIKPLFSSFHLKLIIFSYLDGVLGNYYQGKLIKCLLK